MNHPVDEFSLIHVQAVLGTQLDERLFSYWQCLQFHWLALCCGAVWGAALVQYATCTYMYIHARITIWAAKLQKIFHIHKYMREKVQNFITLHDFLFILHTTSEVSRAKVLQHPCDLFQVTLVCCVEGIEVLAIDVKDCDDAVVAEEGNDDLAIGG